MQPEEVSFQSAFEGGQRLCCSDRKASGESREVWQVCRVGLVFGCKLGLIL